MRECLECNTILKLTEAGTNNIFDIIVGEVIGKGSSCVVYDAIRRAGDNEYKIRLKQFNPLFSDYEEERFIDGAKRNIEIQNEISNSSSKAFGICRDSNGCPFVIVDYDNGSELSKIENISFYEFAVACRDAAIVLEQYHNKGYLHLDIKPSNILVINSEGMNGVKLFDFDSVVQKSELMNSDATISCSQGYAAPEVLQNNRLKISEKSDFYSIGVMLFEFLYGRMPSSIDRSIASKRRDFSEINALEDVNPRVLPKLEKFLNKTIVSATARRYDSDSDLISDLKEITELAGERNYLVSSNLSDSYFVGRESELEEIHENLKQGNHIFISGIGGIGKSELARAYAIKHKDEFSTISFGMLTNDIMTFVNDDEIINIANYSNNGELTEEQYFGGKMIKLSSIVDRDSLIIVDNLENLNDKNLSRLLKLNCKIIFTTRDFKPEDYDYSCIHIGELSNEQLAKILWKWYNREEQTEQTQALAYELISLVHNHTLAVELLAKQMNASRISLKQMLNKLNEKGLSNSGNEKIRYQKDGEDFNSNTIGILRNIFSLADLSNEKQRILLNLALLPPAGISDELFKECCELEDFSEINELEELGWIKTDGNKIALHPVVAEVILASVEFKIDDVKTMLDNLSDRLDDSNNEMVDIANHTPFLLLKYSPSLSHVFRECYKIVYKAMKLLIKRGAFDLAKSLLDETTLVDKAQESTSQNNWSMNPEWTIENICYILFEGMVLFKELGEFNQAQWIFDFISNNFLFCPTELELETNYEYANIMVRQHRFNEATELYSRNRELIKSISENFHLYSARLDNEIGLILTKSGKYKEALDIHRNALFLLEISNASEYLFADVHRRLASVYYSMGEYENAIEEYNKALEYKDTSNIYSYIYRFKCYAKLNDFDSFENDKEALLERCKKEYGKESYFVERVLSHSIDLYIHLGLYEKAVEVAKQALEIEEKLFGEYSQNVAWGYYNVANANFYAGDYSNAEYSLHIARDKRHFTSNSVSILSVRISELLIKINEVVGYTEGVKEEYSNLATTLIDIGDYDYAWTALSKCFDDSLQYAEKCLKICVERKDYEAIIDVADICISKTDGYIIHTSYNKLENKYKAELNQSLFNALYFKADALLNTHRAKEAIDIYKQLISSFDSAKENPFMKLFSLRYKAIVSARLANAYSVIGDSASSIEHYETAINSVEELELDFGYNKFKCFCNMANEFVNLGVLQNAKDCYKKALSLCEFNVDSVFESKTENFYKTIEIVKAVAKFDSEFAKAILKELIPPVTISCVQLNAGGLKMLNQLTMCYKEIGLNDEAIKVYESISERIRQLEEEMKN